MGLCVPRQPEQHPGGVPVTLTPCRTRPVAGREGHRPRHGAGCGDKAQGPGQEAQGPGQAPSLSSGQSSPTGSLPHCGVPGRCDLRTGAVAEGPSLLVPDRTSSQLSCRLLATQRGFRMNWQRQAHSACSPRPPGGGYKCRLKRSKAERWSRNREGAHRCRAWESG